MKNRIWILLLIMIMVFSAGCSPKKAEKDPGTDYSVGYLESEVWFFEDRAFINCSHSGKYKILYGDLSGEEMLQVYAENAKIFDLFGSALVCYETEEQQYRVYDLRGEKEVVFDADALSAGILTEQTLCLFGNEGQQEYCYKIDLSSMRFSKEKSAKSIERICLDGDQIYYTYWDLGATVLMHYDRATGQEKEIYRNEKGVGFDFNEKWFIYWSGIYNNPYIYDRATGAVRRAYDDPYGATIGLYEDYVLRDVDLRNGMHQYAVFDLSKGAEVPMEDLGLSNSIRDFDLFEDGFVYYDTYPLQTASVYIGSEKRTVTVNKKFTKGAVLNVEANEKGIAFITESELYTATWEDPVLNKYDHGK